MAGYADLAEAKRRLNLTVAHTAEAAALADLDEAVARLFDDATGRTFDGAAGTVTHVIEAPGVSDLLLLPAPVRTVASVVEGGTWDGAAWDDAVTLDADDYRVVFGNTDDGWLALRRLSGLFWAGPVRVTGTWEPDEGAGIPVLVEQACTAALVREYRRMAQAPGGGINLDELETPTPSGLTDPLWKRAVATYRVGAFELVV